MDARGVSAPTGVGALFDGEHVIEMGDRPELRLATRDVTFTTWLKLSAETTINRWYISKAIAADDNARYAMGVNLTAQQPGVLLHGNNSSGINVAVGPSLDDEWHQITTVFDRSGTNTIRTYVDGELVDSTAITAGWRTQNIQGNFPFRLGAYTASDGTSLWNPLEGAMSEVRMAYRSLTPEWIATEYANQADPSSFYAVT